MPVTGHDTEVVLDFGCGPGNDLVNLIEHSKPRRLVGADISAGALEESRQRLALHPGGEDVELVVVAEGAPTLPFGNDEFDCVHCDGVIHHTPNPMELLREFHRILRPGGEARRVSGSRLHHWRARIASEPLRGHRR
jgi:ubiquinone/menaquinone biosynthesis C-methylase UbiE